MSVDPITCHILDTYAGRPAEGVTCQIYRVSDLIENKEDEAAYDLATSQPFAMAKTDADGRIKNWTLRPTLSEQDKHAIGVDDTWTKLSPGLYKVKFLTGKYFHQQQKARTFFPFVEIHFQIENPPDNHYHIPLLLSNYSYTTYRGS